MPRLAACLAFLALSVAAHAAPAEFLRVWPQWRSAESFKRIAEFFGAPETTGREVILRTHPENRDGYYFLVRVKHDAGLAGATFVVHVIRPDGPEARTFTFPVPAAIRDRAGETVFLLGLTGADWPGGEEVHPVAWKLELQGANQDVLAAKKSFLWEMPAK